MICWSVIPMVPRISVPDHVRTDPSYGPLFGIPKAASTRAKLLLLTHYDDLGKIDGWPTPHGDSCFPWSSDGIAPWEISTWTITCLQQDNGHSRFYLQTTVWRRIEENIAKTRTGADSRSCLESLRFWMILADYLEKYSHRKNNFHDEWNWRYAPLEIYILKLNITQLKRKIIFYPLPFLGSMLISRVYPK